MSSSFKTAKGTELPLLDMRGKPYLQVAHRLVWFREERPGWSIETELLPVDTPETALARAIIRDESGRIMATAHKVEDKRGFADFREKAETGAIGRALALVGYGTQFAPELDEQDRIVDSPIAQARQPRVVADQPGPSDGFPPQGRGYVIDFGKWNAKTLEQVYRDRGPKEIEDYIAYLEGEARKKGAKPSGKVAFFIQEAEQFLGAMENSHGLG